MIKECFGEFGKLRECLECMFADLCSCFWMVYDGKMCPLYGVGFEGSNEICKLCIEYFVGKECKRLSAERGRGDE